MNPIDENPRPQGELALQTVAMPADTNANGDIFGGWLLSQMDIAGGVAAAEVARGRCNGSRARHVFSHPSSRWCRSELLLRHPRYWSQLCPCPYRGMDQFPTRWGTNQSNRR